jgi:hypothetical protein
MWWGRWVFGRCKLGVLPVEFSSFLRSLATDDIRFCLSFPVPFDFGGGLWCNRFLFLCGDVAWFGGFVSREVRVG